jgi:hypothetical protein
MYTVLLSELVQVEQESTAEPMYPSPPPPGKLYGVQRYTYRSWTTSTVEFRGKITGSRHKALPWVTYVGLC